MFGGKSLFIGLHSWLQFGQKNGISIATKRYESKNISHRQTTKKRFNTKKNPLSVAMQQIADLVEVRGVEPLSESTSVRLSPGAGHSLSFPPLQVKGQTCRFSSFIVHGARKA